MTSQNQQTNPWFGLSMVLVGVITGYGLAMASGGGLLPSGSQAALPSGKDAAPAPTPPPTAQAPTYDSLIPFDPETDYYRGNPNAKIALIEYSDYECPFCQRHHPTMQQAVDANGDDVVWVFRHYPLSFHANAKPSAIAAECVGEIAGNNKFWEFTDLLFAKGTDASSHLAYAEQIGVDTAAFESCIASGKYSDKVDQQLAEGTSAGVRGTPGTFVFNTETKETGYISGAQPLSNIQSVIDGML